MLREFELNSFFFGSRARLSLPMARKVKPLEEKARRAALVKAAYYAIYEHGYASVTLADIARAAGVSKGTLVYYFGTKEGLFKLVLDRFIRTITFSTAKAVRSKKTPLEKLEAFVNYEFYGLENTKRFYTVYLDFLSASTKESELALVTRQFFKDSEILELQIAALGSGFDTEAQSWQIRALVDGLSIRFVFDENADLELYRTRCLSGMRALLGI